MKKITMTLVLAGAAVGLSSCGKKEDLAPEPVKQPVVQKAPAPAPPVADANPTNLFRTPEDDMNLPTEEQIAEGKDTSIGTGVKPVSNPSAPSVAVKPPSTPTAPKVAEPTKPPEKEDQLDPQ